MPLPAADVALLRKLYANLSDAPLPPDSPSYQPVYQELGLDDPMQQRSTLNEALRLRRVLEERGYFVRCADALRAYMSHVLVFHSFFGALSTHVLRSGTCDGTMRCMVYDMFWREWLCIA